LKEAIKAKKNPLERERKNEKGGKEKKEMSSKEEHKRTGPKIGDCN